VVLTRVTVPGLEPGSEDRGKAGYEGSDDDTQCADERDDNGVSKPDSQDGHSSPALPESPHRRSGSGEALGSTRR
jgi:hypothetical protein